MLQHEAVLSRKQSETIKFSVLCCDGDSSRHLTYIYIYVYIYIYLRSLVGRGGWMMTVVEEFAYAKLLSVRGI